MPGVATALSAAAAAAVGGTALSSTADPHHCSVHGMEMRMSTSRTASAGCSRMPREWHTPGTGLPAWPRCGEADDCAPVSSTQTRQSKQE